MSGNGFRFYERHHDVGFPVQRRSQTAQLTVHYGGVGGSATDDSDAHDSVQVVFDPVIHARGQGNESRFRSLVGGGRHDGAVLDVRGHHHFFV